MLEIFNGKKAAQYIFFEMIPSFLLGLIIFISIILMFQVLRLTEFALVHGVNLKTIMEIIGFISISLLPVLLPMSLLFSIILTYGRLSSDSEIVAMKASGMHMGMLTMPAMILAVIVGIISAQTSFTIAPWGNRQFEVLYRKIANMRAGIALKEGTFAEGFFDMVIYAGAVDSKNGNLRKVFIFDESSGSTPITIISKEGQIIPDPDAPGHNVLMRLKDGDIHRMTTAHTKIKFDTYDIQLSDPIKEDTREKSSPSWTMSEIEKKLKKPELLAPEELTAYSTEYHKRWATSILCVVFGMIGVGLGTTTNRRSAKAGGMILSIGIIIVYWILYVIFEGLARSGAVPTFVVWIPNLIFGIVGFESLRKNWN